MSNLIDIYSTEINITIWLVGLSISYVGGMKAEHKFKIINIFNKKWAHFKNKKAEIDISFRYKPKKEFNQIKIDLKKSLLNSYSNYDLLNENDVKIYLSFDIFTMKIIHDEFNNVFIDLSRTSCGINDLKEKVETLLSFLNKLNDRNHIFDDFISCDVSVRLPYQWSYVKINEPKGFELKDYTIEMQKIDGYKSKVKLYLHSLNASLTSIDEINPLLDKLL